jgi:pimeloyl-ACP methyl ester carboxylesterase
MVAIMADEPLLPAEVATLRGLALTHIALRGAGELTRLVAETHATISKAPLPWNREGMAEARQAPFPYRLIAQGFFYLARLAQGVIAPHGTLPATGNRGRLFYSALNGVCGDKLEAWNSPLAQRMQLCDEHGRVLPGDWGQDAKGVVIFIHGLCLSEREWQTPAHAAFVQDLRQRKQAVAWLRYNSGRHIHQNGRSLSELLERRFGNAKSPLTLVGHSMGGLLIRSAAHTASTENSQWLARLKHAAYLAAPHQGAPLERLGNGLNNMLGFTPYSRPFMRLGNIRSNGIRDLHNGRLSIDTANPPLAAGVRHLMVAGELEDVLGQLLGDGMVPLSSALGPVDIPEGVHVTRRELPALGHMAVLKDERVYKALQDWLESRHH